MPKLKFHNVYESIRSFPSCELPALTVVTGINGAGKTHLLRAIETGHIQVEGIQNSGEIKYYDWTSFAPQVNQGSSPQISHQNRENALQQVWQHIEQGRNLIARLIPRRDIDGDNKLYDVDWLLGAKEWEILKSITEAEKGGEPLPQQAAQQLSKKILQQRATAEKNVFQNVRQFGSLEQDLEELAKDKACSILCLTRDEIREVMPAYWSNVGSDMLKLQIADWFTSWHAAYEYNKINKYYATAEGDAKRHWVDEETFRKKHGSEPWDIANRVLEEAGLRYRFNRPEFKIDQLHNSYNLKLVDPEDGTEILPQKLSTGEKIILSIVMMLYHKREKAFRGTLPKLLLLDEVDAPLHPSFTRLLFKFLDEEIVQGSGVSVIMASHSPSTVALAPEGSVYELTRKPRRLRPITPSTATDILSSGYVSLARNDIIVITESGNDIGYHNEIYRALCAEELMSDHPNLKFIPASRSKKRNEDGGCTQVRNWAPKLADLGIGRFKGLVDRDSGVAEDSVVTVLKRYSWENYLFDPLTIAGYLIHRTYDMPFEWSKSELKRIEQLNDLDKVAIGALVDATCKWIATELGEPDINGSDKVACDYIGWSGIEVPKWFITEKGHDVEVKIRECLNEYRKKQRKDALIKKDRYEEIIRFQAVVAPRLISRDLVDIYERLRVEIVA